MVKFYLRYHRRKGPGGIKISSGAFYEKIDVIQATHCAASFFKNLGDDIIMADRLLLASPHMSDEGFELEYIHDAFQKNWIAPLGENVNEFEKSMQSFIGAGHMVALSAGTAALHLSMILAGVQPGDKVFCQDLTFSASANPVAYVGAEPVFIDSEQDTWNMDPAALEKAFELYGIPKAVIVVHLYGNPAKLDEITAICQKHGVTLIEDAAEALGSDYAGRKCGTFGKFGVLSFNGNKIITPFQLPSWYNARNEHPENEQVLAPFQLPSWYNTKPKKAPVTRGFLGFVYEKTGHEILF